MTLILARRGATSIGSRESGVFFTYLGESGVERGGLGLCDGDKSGRRALRDQPVRVAFADQSAPSCARFFKRGARRQAQDRVGIPRFGPQMGRLDAPKIRARKAEKGRHLFQKSEFRRRHRAIGGGDMEQTIQHIFQQAWAVPVFAPDLARIAFKAQNGLLRDGKGQAKRPFFTRRGAKHHGGGGHFRIRRHPIGLGHFCRQADHGGREPDIIDVRRALIRRRGLNPIVIERPRGEGDYSAPNAHQASVTVRGGWSKFQKLEAEGLLQRGLGWGVQPFGFSDEISGVFCGGATDCDHGAFTRATIAALNID